MLKLHGISGSNYYSMAKACLLEKAIAFEEVKNPPSQDADYLSISPMGKVPCLETAEGFISETYAIADYLEVIQPEPRLLPKDPFARAKTIELVRHMELDIELVARRCLPQAFFGRDVSEETRTATRHDLDKGMAALTRLTRFAPYAAGDHFTLADIYAFYTFTLASAIIQKVFAEDLLSGAPAARDLLERLGDRPSIAAVETAKA